MAKVDIDLVRKVLQRNEIDYETISQVLEDLELEVGGPDAAESGELLPPVKKQFVILISDPNGKFTDELFTGWVLQIPEDQSPLEVTTRLMRAAYDFNQSKKGARDPAQTITDVCEVVPAKFLKPQQVWVKTKEPILVIRTDNKIPFTAPGHKNEADDSNLPLEGE
ncbi:MAG: hypothetical protein LBB26_00305 [Puniceicoccales bacterium]|jgi:hypothetical protein|nr:hypothetical protein [Puniceicoccales bacterium]